MEYNDKQAQQEGVQAAKTNKSSFVIIVILIVMVAALVVTLLWCLQQSKPTPTTPGDTPSPTAGPCYDGSANTAPTGYRFYENEALGFKFAYPEAWGDVTISTDPEGGSGGHYLMGNFADNDKVWFGGNATNYVVLGRDGMPTDNPGYLVASNKYYSVEIMKYDDSAGHIEARNNLYPLEKGAELKNGCNAKALVSKYPKVELPGYSYDLARFNLQPDNDYYGVNFVMRSPTAASRTQFNNVISSFQLIP